MRQGDATSLPQSVQGSGRPARQATTLFAADVASCEKKRRMRNGSHRLIAHPGIPQGLEFVRDVRVAPEPAAQEIPVPMQAAAAMLAPVPGIDLDACREDLPARLASHAIAHPTIQIAMDATQKLPRRILSPAAEAVVAGRNASALARATDAGIATPARPSAENPRGEELMAAVEVVTHDPPSALFLTLEELFSSTLAANADRDAPVDDAIRAVLARARPAGATP